MASNDQPVRIGHGYDVHRFIPGDHVMLGGVRIPHHQGLAAHSDGDVLVHAVCDALLGAIAEGDIGRLFPDTEAEYADIDSCLLLAEVCTRVQRNGYRLGNLDVTVIAQAPVLAPHIPAMRSRLADVCSIFENQINIKATTTETLGFAGREEGIAAHAVVLISRRVE